jgi:hypothetical protein
MQLPKPVREWWPVALLSGLLGAIGWFGAKIIDSASAQFWKYIAPAIPQTLLLSLCCLLLLVIALLAISVIYLHRLHLEPTEDEKSRAFDERFEKFLPKQGVWTHKTQSGYFCPPCKAKRIESPMMDCDNALMCPLCQYASSNPDYKAPPSGRQKPPGIGPVLI